MIPTGVQQFMLGTALNNETQARQTLDEEGLSLLHSLEAGEALERAPS